MLQIYIVCLNSLWILPPCRQDDQSRYFLATPRMYFNVTFYIVSQTYVIESKLTNEHYKKKITTYIGVPSYPATLLVSRSIQRKGYPSTTRYSACVEPSSESHQPLYLSLTRRHSEDIAADPPEEVERRLGEAGEGALLER